MYASRLSAKCQVTVPKEIRDAIGLKPGDMLAYKVEDGCIIVRRIEPFDAAYHAAISNTLSEWDSVADDEAFGDL